MNARNLIKFLLLIISGTILAACATIPQDAGSDEPEDPENRKTIYVGPILVSCEGVAPQTCMLVKESLEEDFRYFYDQIEGFTFEPGYTYELVVDEEQIENPPADASSIKWVLVEEKGKVPAVSPLDKTTWLLDQMTNEDGMLDNVLPSSMITVEFQTVDLSGNAGCNNYFSAYTIDGERIFTGLAGSTQMFCIEPEGIMEQENLYLLNLQNASSYQITDNQLSLIDADGMTILIYKLLEPASLVNTQWMLTGYNNGKGGFTSLLSGTEINAEFDENGSLSGNAGCNNYNTSYELDGDSITIGMPATTRMFCGEPEGVMEQETAYLAALQTAVKYEIKSNELNMFNQEDGRALSFVARQTPNLEELRNSRYLSEWFEEGFVQLENGEFTGPATPESASEITVRITDQIAFGQLEDGSQIAAVVLVTDGGGSGSFYDLAIVGKQGSEIQNSAITSLGDRVQINSIEVIEGKIILDMIIHGPDDPMCCPSMPVKVVVVREGDKLVQESSTPVTVNEIDKALLDITWEWQGSLYSNDTSAIPNDTSKYSIQFMDDSTISVQADCNMVLGTYAVNGNQITIETGVSTLAACPPDSLDSVYLRDLNASVIYFFEGDQLFIDLKFDSGTMQFSQGN